MRPIPNIALLNDQSEVSVYLEKNWPKHSRPTMTPYEVEITKIKCAVHAQRTTGGEKYVLIRKKIIKRDSKDKITMITGSWTF